MSSILTIFVFLFLIFTIFPSVRICRENEQFAISRLGRMLPLRGPGLVFNISGIDRYKIKIGERAEIIDHATAEIKGMIIPVIIDKEINVITSVRIVQFRGSPSDGKAKVEIDPDSRIEIRCEKFGHIIRV